MGESHIFDWIVGVATMLIGFFLKKTHSDVTDNTAAIQNLRTELAKDYISKDDYREDMREIKDVLKQIYQKVDGKADKR